MGVLSTKMLVHLFQLHSEHQRPSLAIGQKQRNEALFLVSARGPSVDRSVPEKEHLAEKRNVLVSRR